MKREKQKKPPMSWSGFQECERKIMGEHISYAWDAPLARKDFEVAEQAYGQLGSTIADLVERINSLASRLSDSKSGVTRILLVKNNDDQRSEVWYIPAVLLAPVMNVHFSALNCRALLELYLTGDGAKLFYDAMRESLALGYTIYHKEGDLSFPDRAGQWYIWKGREKVSAMAKQLERWSVLPTGAGKPKGKNKSPKEPSRPVKYAWESYKWAIEDKPELMMKLQMDSDKLKVQNIAESRWYSKETYNYIKETGPFYVHDPNNPTPRMIEYQTWTRYLRIYQKWQSLSRPTPYNESDMTSRNDIDENDLRSMSSQFDTDD